MEFLRLICKFIFSVFIRTKVIDPEKFPKEGAVIVAANHESMLDMFMIGLKQKRYIKWMAKEELFKNKILGGILSSFGAYPVKRGGVDVSAVRTTMNLLEKGEAVGIFPQGTRSKGRGRANKAKSGVARLALDTGAWVQPVAIWGRIGLFGKVYVKFGDPYKIEKIPGKIYEKSEYGEVAQSILDNIYGMMEDESGNNKG